MLNHRILTRQLKMAINVLGKKELESFAAAHLPVPLRLDVHSHDTGCQASITAQASDMPRVCVWDGSIWYSTIYEFNDRNKMLGLNPDFATIAPKIEAFFIALDEAVKKEEERRVADASAAKDQKARETQEAINAYLAMIG